MLQIVTNSLKKESKLEKIHFISGLPRSGTTLLSAILNQNPRFSASISGPAARIVRAIVMESQAQTGYKIQCPESKRKKLIGNMLDTYYEDSNPVVFDTNRGWGLMTPLLADMYPESKMICCVRDIPWVIDSFEQLFRKNPYSMSSMFNESDGVDVYARANSLMRPDRTIGFALNALKQAAFGGERSNILLVRYEDLSKNPERILKDVYAFIGEPYFAHDFNHVETSHDEFDADVGLKGMHSTRAKVEFIQRRTILPPDLWQGLEPLSFWNQMSKGYGK